MHNKEALKDILNDLIKINNDRIAGYEFAINEAKDLDVDLKAIFQGMIRESNQYKEELTNKVRHHGGMVAGGTTASGKIYRAWLDVKATFAGSDRKSILAACEFGEDAAQRAYDAALSSGADIDADCYQLIVEQQRALKNSHDLIKKFRDVHEAIS